MTAPAPARPGGRPRPDASMTLLVEVMERPLDPAYAEAAARRRAVREGRAPDRRSPVGVVLLVLVAILLGLMTASAARQLRVPQEGVAEARALLEDEIAARSAQAEALQARSATLSDEIEALQRATLARDPVLAEQLRLDGLVNGSRAVRGPGLVVTLTDGGGGLTDGDGEPGSRVQYTDVRTVVNALWAAGAEAVSVDGQRLTSVSAIRNAGDAILVDLVPLPGPTYTIRAIGDPQAMQAAYARSDAPTYLQLLASGYGIESSVTAAEDLELPGVGTQQLRSAEPLSDALPSPSGTATEEVSP
ncbi:DUF881 domain-containing protein [Isoptericola variabilis]|uniref:Membrane associated protein n=1 Tax=Isoptericola variabilis (strain 225) TaxID=743718 RepID=F6FUZ7_ISOV2|nr:DUF881 domain-containing protein [Isoptericola variabilis]AEG44337.1 protein of unknown function DUF881 [Isoptericola variabilis 225]TWH31075.1 uncharacterized protein YlxW (UPF0749 family) [Isoptericola variabilis J7]